MNWWHPSPAVWKHITKRSAKGDFRAWTLRDRRVVRAERLVDGVPAEVVRYDVTGRAESRVTMDGEQPVSVWVDGGELDAVLVANGGKASLRLAGSPVEQVAV